MATHSHGRNLRATENGRMLLNELSRKLRNARMRRGYSQAHTCIIANVSRTTLSNIENESDDPRLSIIMKLADALGMDIEINLVPRGEKEMTREEIAKEMAEKLKKNGSYYMNEVATPGCAMKAVSEEDVDDSESNTEKD